MINKVFKILNLKAIDSIILCGFDYEVLCFNNGVVSFGFDYNSKCKYARIEEQYYSTEDLWNAPIIKKFTRISEAKCLFVNYELKECYLKSLKEDNRIEIINIKSSDSLKILYNFSLKSPP